ncbi:DUF3667 domain-containing protein [Paucihalobacter sp.]|uniref:DUF3667 domain-containing protein n=1 Tax=Paucihalobacter sp. TaxID=2850405 RepID=UPI002FE3B2D9
MKSEQHHCLNCGYELEDDFEFCPHCGQKTEDKLTIGVLFYNTISNYFSFDARFLKSFVPLIFRPGYLPAKFLEGKRLLYLHPAQMYLFISVIFFFIFSFSVREQVQAVNKAVQKATLLDSPDKAVKKFSVELDTLQTQKIASVLKENQKQLNIPDEDLKEIDSVLKGNNARVVSSNGFPRYRERELDSLISLNKTDDEIYAFMGLKSDATYLTRRLFKQLLKFHKTKDGGTILQTFYDSIPIVLFFLLPLFALFLKILYFNKGTYPHHLVFSFYYFAFVFAVLSIFTILNLNWEIYELVNTLFILALFVYLFLAMKRFYRQGVFLTIFKFGVLSFSFLLFITPITAIFLIFYALLFY